ncbi:hypothetical protein R626_00495 [Salmonella enterica subsp. enterica serovar Senftenberg]|nr:hypothetical protein [Salmonella enterica subsp. enterica serovar Senftenberg]ECZ1080872.1 hypothetical protein [Salmonella enterica]ECZ5381031.1 hypothetical protein [Salmonella enterica subsp. enterica serovar Senftenberg]EEK1983408.1 hypothetical protein [Salmonella enterica subsp. enterica serovar Senftenberg]
MVARSVRRCAAVDPGGFDAAFSRNITPMRQAIRASSPHVLAHSGHLLYPIRSPRLFARYHGAN